jgi:co-chaperonin GroES (HSP10)
MLYPMNRYLVVEEQEVKEREEYGILIPESALVDTSSHKVVKLLRAHEQSALKDGQHLLVPRHSIERVEAFGEAYELVLENHVLGYIEE